MYSHVRLSQDEIVRLSVVIAAKGAWDVSLVVRFARR